VVETEIHKYTGAAEAAQAVFDLLTVEDQAVVPH
jgi:hypothetical protein